jgi:hypothetical protein
MQSTRYSCNISIALNFKDRFFFENAQTISLKSVERETIWSVRTGRKTDKTKLIVAFRIFANMPEDYKFQN